MIKLDRSSGSWYEDEYLMKMQIMFINQLINYQIKTKGYMYLNQIYEALDVKWDTSIENKLYLYNGIKSQFYLDYTYQEDGSALIDIYFED